MFEYRGEVICPAAYVEGRTELATVLPQVLSSLQHAARKKEHLVRLLPALVAISYRLGLELGLPDEALTLLKASAKRAPNFAPLWTAMAVLLGRLGRTRESLRAAEAAFRADNQSSAALVALAYAQSQIGSHDRAIRTAREATKLAPKDDFAWLNLGVVLSKRGLHYEAVSALRRACELNPQSARAWYSLGVAYDRSDQRDKAIDACKQATTLDPLDADAWHTLGIAYDRSGETDRAVEALRRAQQLDDSDGATWLSLSRALFSGGRTEQALVTLRGAAIRAAADPDLLSRISVAYGQNGRYIEAVEAAKEALKIDPDHVDAWRSLAINLANLPGSEEEALQARHRVADTANTADDWYGLSVAYGKAGLYEEAVTAARKAIEIDPDHVDAWRSLAINLDQMGRSKEALVALKRVDELTDTASGTTPTQPAADEVLQEVEANPASADAWRGLASVYRRAGRAVEAVSVARNAVERAPHIAPHTIALVEELLNEEPQPITTLLEYLVALDRGNDQYVHLLGAARRKAGHPQDAVDALRTACHLAPERENYWYALGKALEEVGNSDAAAQAAYERAVQLKPDYTKARLALRRLTVGGGT